MTFAMMTVTGKLSFKLLNNNVTSADAILRKSGSPVSRLSMKQTVPNSIEKNARLK